MKRAFSNRVSERLRRLREEFGAGVHDRQVDHDHEHLTSTRRDLVPVRTFFLGEIWWADRHALGDPRPHREGSSHLPALVTKRERLAGEPVETAPSARHAPEDIDELCFRPSGPPDGLYAETTFLLPYRRPVARESFGAKLATITGSDKARLSQLLDCLRPPEPMHH